MPLTLVRVDDRLIHGQVVAVWLKARPARRIVVVDDASARDPFLHDLLRLAAPQGVDVEVYETPAGIERARQLGADAEPAFVLVLSPETALALREGGVAFDVLNVGALGATPERRRLHRSVAASDRELAALRRLEELGTRVELQAVPAERPVTLASVAP